MCPRPKPDLPYRIALAFGLTLLVATTSLLLAGAEWLAGDNGLAFLNRTHIPQLVLYGTIPLLLWSVLAAIVGLTAFLAVDYARDRRRRP
jgi:hypothetical protein